MTRKFTKGHYSVKSVGRVKVLVLCTSSVSALYLYQVWPKYLKGFQSYSPGQWVNARLVANVQGRTDGRTDGKTYPYNAPCRTA